MIQELIMAAQSVTALSTLLKSAKTLSNYNEIVTAVSEINSKLMAANSVGLASQEKQAALSAKIDELEQEIMRLKNWGAERDKYERRQIATGIFAYIEREFMGNLETAHKYCCNCFDKTIPSTLQQGSEIKPGTGRIRTLVCPNGCPTIEFRHGYI